MPNPFRRLSNFFQDRVTGFTREINNTFSVITGRRQTPLPEETPPPTPEASPVPPMQETPQEPSSFLGFIKSVATSPFAKEVSQTAAQKSTKLTENAVFAGSMLVGHLLLGPLGAIGLGVGVDFLQNRNQGRRQTLGKTVVTSGSITAGALAGAGIGAALGIPLGPVGVIIGSGVGSATGGLVARLYSHRLTASLTNIFTAAQNPLSPNSFVTITSNLTSIMLLPITIPFNLFLKPLLVGCLIFVALILSAIFLIFALFIIPNPQTTGSPTGPTTPPGTIASPLPGVDCFNFDDSWVGQTSQQALVSEAVQTLVSRFPNLTNLACGIGITLSYNPPIVDFCGLVDGSTIYFSNLFTCNDSADKQSFTTYLLAHELGHQLTESLKQEFQAAIGSEPGLISYPTQPPPWYEDLAESIAIYVRCKLYGDDCHIFDSYPNHMQFVEQYIGTII